MTDVAISRAQRYAIMAVAVLGVILVTAAIASINLALPDIQRQLRASQTDLQWIVDSYTVVLAALLLFAGALGDRFGHKNVLLVGLVVFGATSFGAAEAGGASGLIFARAGMGVGAALLFPTTLSMITTSFPAAERSQAVAIWATATAAGGIVGLVECGIVLTHWWWGSMFLINVVLSAACVIVAIPLVPQRNRERNVRLDPGGALLAVLAIGGVVYGIIEGPTSGWFDPPTVGAIVGGLAAGGVFIAYEHRARRPMLDPQIFVNRSVSAGSLIMIVEFLGAYSFLLILSEYLQFLKGFSPLAAGMAVVPMGATIVVGAVAGHGLGTRLSLRVTGSIGLVLMVGACLTLAVCRADSSYWQLPLLGGIMAGLSVGCATTAGTTAITEGLPAQKQGVASALNDTTREFGAALGIAFSGSLLIDAYRSSLNGTTVLRHLPPKLAASALSGVGTAQRLAAQDALPALRTAGNAAFASGMRFSMIGMAMLLVIGLVVLVVISPRQRRAAEAPPLTGAPPVVVYAVHIGRPDRSPHPEKDERHGRGDQLRPSGDLGDGRPVPAAGRGAVQMPDQPQ